ncbi:MAG: uroporphyrinogen-III C-methyltransferase [Deltaproteobacteria bacterium]
MNAGKGPVYLIGAGPGDPGLLTVKGKEYLQRAEVVVYDYLVNPLILDYAKPSAERIYVGKERKSREIPQEQINQILVEKASEGYTVARLKGGDPFIFGRGGEEAEALARAGISFEIVPGISSALAVPAYAGIPLTHRNFTSSFIVATGHEDPEKQESTLPWEALAKTGTVVFLMSILNLKHNMEKLIEFGKPADTPVAIISWGTYPKQKTLRSAIGQIGEIMAVERISPPAVVIVGEVVNLREQINWFERKPLFGKKILVTRARKQAGGFTKLLQEQGADVIEFPTIEIKPPQSWEEFDGAAANLSRYDWIVFTSVNGVEGFFSRLRENGVDFRELKGVKIAAIGEQTAKSVSAIGLLVDIAPSDFRAEGLISGFCAIGIAGKRILIPRAKEAREVLPVELARMGAEVHVVAAYETMKPSGDKVNKIRELLISGEIDAVTFASSSSARNFISEIGSEGRALSKTAIACIGPITAEAIREIGMEPQIICKKYTVQELCNELVEYFRETQR